MRLGAHYRLFLSYSLLVAAVVVVLTLGLEATLRPTLAAQIETELLRELSLGSELYDRSPEISPTDAAELLGSVTGHRVTVIARDGTVLGDSDVATGMVPLLDNHLERPEVREALAEGAGTAIRFSTSVGEDLLYAAIVTGRGEVMRFAISIAQVDEAVAAVRRQVLVVGGIALLLAAIFSLFFSLAITRPLRRMRSVASSMAAGDLSRRLHSGRRDELGELGSTLDHLADELQRRISQLEGEREEMTALIDSMSEGVLAIGADGTLRRANPAAKQMFDLGDDARGLEPEAIARRRDFLEVIHGVLEGRAVSATEITRNGRHLLVTAEPLPRGGGVIVLLDTTELRRLEGVRRDFVANASHELKTPLTAIKGYSETLLDNDLPEEVRSQFTRTLHTNVSRLQNILDDLLDLSKIESGGWTIDYEQSSIERTASEAWTAFVDQAAAKGISFDLDTGAGADEVEADPAALAIIFSNLFSNALRYTPEGGSIRVRTERAGVSHVEVEVIDTGSGIPRPHLTRIFERFYRVDPARSRAEGGTGLGLAIVRHLVERHGGTIEADSEVGRGTTIRFVIPIRQLPD